jgi:hypothetical protein
MYRPLARVQLVEGRHEHGHHPDTPPPAGAPPRGARGACSSERGGGAGGGSSGGRDKLGRGRALRPTGLGHALW